MRVVHFEIHAADVPRALDFYTRVFGWASEDFSHYAGMPYYGLITGAESTPGINGALMQRQGDNPAPGAPVVGAALTVEVDDFDEVASKILKRGGTVALEKHALPGMAWQGYFFDTEGNIFGLHQPDENAS